MGGSEFRSEPRGRLLATQHHLAPTLGLRRTCVELCYPAMATADSLLECYDPHLRACERMVRAEQRIESNVASKPFHVDYYQLVSIGNHCTHTPMDPPLRPRAKCIKVRCCNKQLCCEQEPDQWMYRVRLALNCSEQNLVALVHTEPMSSGEGRIRILLCTTRAIEAGEELCFWPSFQLHLMLGIPFLTPANILNQHCYICTRCGQSFTQPNPLKIHLRFTCESLFHARPLPAWHTPTASSSDSCLPHGHVKCRLRAALAAKRRPPTPAESAVSSSNPSASSTSSPKPSPGRKLHTCTFCGKVYTRKYGLKIHIRTHTGVKPLSCRFCGRSFSDPSNLNKHTRLHTQQQSKGTRTGSGRIDLEGPA